MEHLNNISIKCKTCCNSLYIGLFFKKYLILFLVIILVCLMVASRLTINYGVDGDEQRMVKKAETLFETKSYTTSRLPGNPLFEFVLAIILLKGNHVIANLFVFLFYVLSVYAFWLLAAKRDEKILLVSIYALTPIVLVNAAMTMDYIPGLTFLLFSYAFADKKKYILAGVMLGLSIGCRTSALLFLLPLLIFLLYEKAKLQKLFLLVLFTLGIGFIWYIPNFMEFGLKVLQMPPILHDFKTYIIRTGYKGLMLFGPIATSGIIVILLTRITKQLNFNEFYTKKIDSRFMLEASTIVLFLILFIKYSDETEYLIPIIPFFYLLISKFITKKQLVAIGLLIISFSFVGIEFKGGESGKYKFEPKISWGIIVKDYLKRHEIEKLRSGLCKFKPSANAIILSGMGPILYHNNELLDAVDYEEVNPHLIKSEIAEAATIHKLLCKTNVYVVYSLSKKNISILKKSGYDIYMFSEEAPSFTMLEYNYDPFELGIKRLDIFTGNSFYR